MRIISGDFKGQKILTPKGNNTRPTSDARRESLFNILEHRFNHEYKKVLDLFAGSGALGFEALSRGAEEVLFVENNKEAIRCIEKNAENFGVKSRIKILSAPRADLWIKKLSSEKTLLPFQTVFCDPPYEENWAEKVFKKIAKNGEEENRLFNQMTLLVIEESSRIKKIELPESWNPLFSREQGAGSLFFYRKI